MRYCPKCDIVIRGEKRCCPLCQGKITGVPDTRDISGIPETEAFPVLERRISSVTFMKLLTFLFLALEICFTLTDWMLKDNTLWPRLVMLGIFVGWLDVIAAMYLRGNIIKLLTVETYVAIIINCYVDHMTRLHGWSYAWVAPTLFLGLLGATLIIANVTGLRHNEYVSYLALDAAVSLLQLIPIKYEINPVPLPALIVIGCYLILMSALLVFRFRDLKTALERRFSV